MCSLFHAFILCQLWTVYLEQTIAILPAKDEAQLLASSILLDFWGKVGYITFKSGPRFHF
jgi:hypothetical protein